jgi:hypothetical protein
VDSFRKNDGRDIRLIVGVVGSLRMAWSTLKVLAPLALFVATGVEAAPPALSQSVVIAFNPPLDQLIRYRVSKTRTRQQDGQPATSNSASWIEEIRFKRRGADDYLMTWRFDVSSLPADQRSPTALAAMAPWGDTPLEVEIDELGTFVRISDWEEAQNRMHASLAALEGEALKGVAGPQQAQMKAMFASISDLFLKMDENSAPRAILKTLNTIHGWGGTPFEMGKPSEATSLLPIPLGGAPIVTTIKTQLTALDLGKTATVSVEGVADPASLKTVTLALMEQLMRSLPPEKREEGRKAFAGMTMELTDRSSMTFDLPTGQITSYINERIMGIPGQGRGGEILKIEMVR